MPSDRPEPLKSKANTVTPLGSRWNITSCQGEGVVGGCIAVGGGCTAPVPPLRWKGRAEVAPNSNLSNSSSNQQVPLRCNQAPAASQGAPLHRWQLLALPSPRWRCQCQPQRAAPTGAAPTANTHLSVPPAAAVAVAVDDTGQGAICGRYYTGPVVATLQVHAAAVLLQRVQATQGRAVQGTPAWATNNWRAGQHMDSWLSTAPAMPPAGQASAPGGRVPAPLLCRSIA